MAAVLSEATTAFATNFSATSNSSQSLFAAFAILLVLIPKFVE